MSNWQKVRLLISYLFCLTVAILFAFFLEILFILLFDSSTKDHTGYGVTLWVFLILCSVLSLFGAIFVLTLKKVINAKHFYFLLLPFALSWAFLIGIPLVSVLWDLSF